MPELPDVENYGRYLRRTALHKAIRAGEVGDTRILGDVSGREVSRVLRGRRLETTRRHGKHLFVALDRNGWLGLHFGMTGRLRYFKRLEDDPKHDRLRLDFDNGYHLAYEDQRMLGRVRLLDDPDAFIASRKLGPDALDPALDRKAFAERLCRHKGQVKAALMDQSVLAGIGNVYSDEILFQARVHPEAQVPNLRKGQLSSLSAATRRVLRVAIDKGAGTQDVEKRLPRGYLLPHRRDGARCPRCGGQVRALKIAGRTAYICPRCQPEPAARAVGPSRR
jgi:formamidopyrimidine-DNA glycosylase